LSLTFFSLHNNFFFNLTSNNTDFNQHQLQSTPTSSNTDFKQSSTLIPLRPITFTFQVHVTNIKMHPLNIAFAVMACLLTFVAANSVTFINKGNRAYGVC
jgi:hypothetical protein